MPVLAETAIGTARDVAEVAQGKGIVRRGRPQMRRGVLRPAKAGRAVRREGRGGEQGRPDITQAAGQEAGTAPEQDGEQSEPKDESDSSIRPAGDGMKEGRWQPA
jgi:hypothetical protein